MTDTVYTHRVHLTSDFRARDQIVGIIGIDFVDCTPPCSGGDIVTILTTEANANNLVSHGCRAEPVKMAF